MALRLSEGLGRTARLESGSERCIHRLWVMQWQEQICGEAQLLGQRRRFVEAHYDGTSKPLEVLDETKIVLVPSNENGGLVVLVEAMHQHLSCNGKIDTLLVSALDLVEQHPFVSGITKPSLTFEQ